MTDERRGALAVAWLGALLFTMSLVIFLHAYFVTFGRPAVDEPPLRNLIINTTLFTLFAVHHSVLARSRPKTLMTRIVPPDLVRSVYVWIASLLFIAVCLLWRPMPDELYRLNGALALPGYLVQLAGVVLTGRASAAIGVLDLAGVRPVLDARDGRGVRLAPLETSGLYGFVRHPLYFSWALFVFGTPQMTMTRFVFAVVSTLYLAVAIPFEERSLTDVFGNDYRDYQRAVRWRMIPGVY